MMNCPHCGAENADGSQFCTLCLARFGAQGTPPGAPAQDATVQAPPVAQQPSAQPYVSPGDYRAYAQEVA
jgi:hypothetical protein